MSTATLYLRNGDLRPALSAVVHHAGADDDDVFGRIRIALAYPTQAVVSAVDGYTAAAASVEVPDVLADELPVIDLPREAVRDVLAVFKPPSGKDDRTQWNAESLRVETTDTEVTFTEAGALIDGKSLTVARWSSPPDRYPDVPSLLAGALAVTDLDPLQGFVNATLVARFVAAGKAYSEPLVLRHLARPRGYLVSVGDVFTGLLLGIRADEEMAQRAEDHRDAWTAALTRLSREPLEDKLRAQGLEVVTP
ncbi:hypothetical protein GXB85_04595 [Cellulomonas sp. APG4]|uniref:hypothetical protein n=1 Tax=Cellulomonas sp. APG4 TaxID=1538656 RepID=UPI00137A25F9|nr:hypothetical protein [Cellulomonas sp. APG4]NCT90233.1 hypothetical protein [Cellulomonas sp. APG4]